MNASFPQAVAALFALILSCAAAPAQTTDDLVKQGDVFDRKLEPGEALKYYLPAEKAQPDDARLLLRIARQYRHLMADASAREEKLGLGKTALGYAQRAAALAPNDSEAQLSVAISYGKMLPILGSKEQVDTSPRIKSAVDKALALDPRSDVAWHILGRWHRVLADIGGMKRALAGAIYGKLPAGSIEEAERCLQKACALNPSRLMHPIELGRIYAQMGRKDEARRFINKGLAMPNVEKDDAEMKRLGRESLEKIR